MSYFVNFFQSEHDAVKSKLSILVAENQELSKELSKLRLSNVAKSPPENDEIVDCLKQQVKNLLSEKEHLSNLWQNANKTVEILEGELRIFQSGSENLVPKKDLLKVNMNVYYYIRENCTDIAPAIRFI